MRMTSSKTRLIQRHQFFLFMSCLLLALQVISLSAWSEDYQFVRKWPEVTPVDFSNINSLAVDGTGNVYFTLPYDGYPYDRMVVKIDASGQAVASWCGDGTADGRFQTPVAIDLDTSGNVYVVDAGAKCIQKFDPDGVFVCKWGASGTGDGQFTSPCGLAVDSSNNVYVLDSANLCVQKFDQNGAFLAKWTISEIDNPESIAVDASGNAYVTGEYRVLKYDASGVFVTSWGSSGSGSGQFAWSMKVDVDSAGCVYVADADNHRIQKFDGSGVLLGQWGSYGTNDGQFKPLNALALDSSGNVYVADTDNNRIQKFDGNGTFLTLWNGRELEPEEDDYQGGLIGVAVGASGVVYVTDANANCIKMFDGDGAFIGMWGSEGTGNGQFDEPYGVAVDTVGNVYVADAGNSRIQKFDGNGTFVGQWGSEGSGEGQFQWAFGVAVDTVGNVYVTDAGNGRIQKFDGNGTFISQLDGPSYAPAGIAVDASGNVYVADAGINSIQKFDSDGGFLASWGGPGRGNGQFIEPTGIAVDASGSVYVADFSNHRIQKFDGNGTFLTKWGSEGTGDGQFSLPAGVAVDASGSVYVVAMGGCGIQKFDSNGIFLNRLIEERGPLPLVWPAGISVDALGNVYVSDMYRNCIQQFSDFGVFNTTWGTQGTGDGQFREVFGVAVDASGNVYVADTGNDRIQKFDAHGVFMTRWGNVGTGAGQFQNPYGLAVDTSGNVYVADSYNNRIQKFDGNGTFLTQWGTAGVADGEFQIPADVAVDAAGNVYVTDYENSRIQKFDSNGGFIAKWGSEGSGNGQFLGPLGIAVDGLGNVYVADEANNRIQKFDGNGAFITQWGTEGIADGQFETPADVAVDAAGNVYVTDYMNCRIQKFMPISTAPAIENNMGRDYSTNNPLLQLGGVCPDGTAQLRVNGSSDGVDFTAPNRTWSYGGTFAEGPNTLVVESLDAENNVTGTTTITITVDTTPPVPPVVTGASPTKDVTPTWSWTSSEGDVYRCALDNPTLLRRPTTATAFTPAAALGAGAHVLYVQVRDAAGNWSASGEHTIVIDLVPPAAPTITTDGGNGPGADYTVDLGPVELGGGADETTSTVYVNGSRTGVTYNATDRTWRFAGHLAYGENTLVVTALDAAGNVSASTVIHIRRIPDEEIYVDPLGDDETGEGTLDLPWSTIAMAMDMTQGLGSPERIYTIHAAPGVYRERVVFEPHVRLVGAGADATTISYYLSLEPEHVVVTGAEDTALRDCRVTFPGLPAAIVVLLQIDNVQMEVSRVELDGNYNLFSIGASISGTGSSLSSLCDSTIHRLHYGLLAVDTGANIARNTFDEIRGDAVFIQAPNIKSITAGETPLLGAADAASSGLNRFRNVDGFLIKNVNPIPVRAQYNDWGLYSGEEIAAKLSGDVDYSRYVGIELEPGALVVELLDATTQLPLPLTTPCGVGVPELSLTAERDMESGLFLLNGLMPGAVTLQATAPGFVQQILETNVKSMNVTSASLFLNPAPFVREGDVNASGKVDATDIQLVINKALGRSVPVSCDLSGDGKVNAQDVQMVINACLRGS